MHEERAKELISIHLSKRKENQELHAEKSLLLSVKDGVKVYATLSDVKKAKEITKTLEDNHRLQKFIGRRLYNEASLQPHAPTIIGEFGVTADKRGMVTIVDYDEIGRKSWAPDHDGF